MLQNFKETELGIIPHDWDIISLDDTKLFDVSTGGTPSTGELEYYNNGDIPWLKSGDIKGLYIWDVPNRISKLGLENSNARLHPVGSIMLAMSGRGKTRGITAILKVPSTCNQSVAAVIPKSSEIVPEFVHFNLSYRYNELRNITGDEDRSGLNIGLIRKIKLPKPSKKEQTAIAYTLTKIHQAIDIQGKIIETTRQLQKTLISRLIRKGLHNLPLKQTDIGEMPEDWKAVELGDKITIRKDKKISGMSNIAFIPMELIPNSSLYAKYDIRSIQDIHSSKYCEPGDILLPKITPCLENGKQAVVPNIPNTIAKATTEIFPIRPNNDLHNLFLFYILKHSNYRNTLISQMDGSTGRQRVPKAALLSLKVPFPSLSEQIEISDILYKIDFKRSLAEKRKDAYLSLFKTVLHKLMSGEIRANYLEVSTDA